MLLIVLDCKQLHKWGHFFVRLINGFLIRLLNTCLISFTILSTQCWFGSLSFSFFHHLPRGSFVVTRCHQYDAYCFTSVVSLIN